MAGLACQYSRLASRRAEPAVRVWDLREAFSEGFALAAVSCFSHTNWEKAKMADIDIKGMTDKLENNQGCGIWDSMTKLNFSEQESVFNKLQVEANGRPGNHLKFENQPFVNPDGTSDGQVNLLTIKNQGNLVFEVINVPPSQDVQDICKTNR